MKNFIAVGNVLSIEAPELNAYRSGEGVLVGSLFGVVASDLTFPEAEAGTELVVNVTGVYDLPKAPSQAWLPGAKVYWDDTNSRCTTVATDNTLIGVATIPVGAGAGETIGRVRLNGAAV